jgi:hypothetical protein
MGMNALYDVLGWCVLAGTPDGFTYGDERTLRSELFRACAKNRCGLTNCTSGVTSIPAPLIFLELLYHVQLPAGEAAPGIVAAGANG